jgi:hypothetical protein
MLPAGSLDDVELAFHLNLVTGRWHRRWIILQYTQSSAPEDGRNYRPKHVELIGIINKPLLLHIVGFLYYCISDTRSYQHQINMNVLLNVKTCFLYILLNTILLCRLHVWNVYIPFTLSTKILYRSLIFGLITLRWQKLQLQLNVVGDASESSCKLNSFSLNYRAHL